MIVVDTNVVAHLLIPGEWSEAARRALIKDSAWVAPLPWRTELCNVLTLFSRKHGLSPKRAALILDEALELLGGRERLVDPASALALAIGSTCSAYDCECVSLARSLGVPLVTLDRGILREFPETAVALAAFAR